ncbi:MAG TPA: hypothetical protein VMP68_25025 [Candidatus Eisenbacteria bacterium]|nr:hypothetical protein [Candidatus Eisenbacteria bacterium]
MRLMNVCAVALILVSSLAYAKDPKAYQIGRVSQSQAVPCSSGHKTQSLCQEYILESGNIIYQIRPRDRRHVTALQTGDRAEFRLSKGIMLLRSEEAGSKEQSFVVISTSPASGTSAADVRSMRVNHLQ